MNRTLAMGLFLLGGAIILPGCKTKSVELVFRNYTDKSVELELEGDHEGDEDIGYIPVDGTYRYTLVAEKEDLPETYKLKAGKHKVKFTVNERTPSRQFVDVHRKGIRGPRDIP